MHKRLLNLIGDQFKTIKYRDLPLSHKFAIAQYMTVDGEAWGAAKLPLNQEIIRLENEYGDCLLGVSDLPVDKLKSSIMKDEEIAASFNTWNEYHNWYLSAGDIPNHPLSDLWPIILSTGYDLGETLDDGWHRLHSYVRDGHKTIPSIFFINT